MQSTPRAPTSHRATISRASGAYSRKRAVTACQVCRARRTKCDQQRPSCSFCLSIGAECTFQPADHSTFDQASLAIIDRLERMEQKLDGLPHLSPQQPRQNPWSEGQPRESRDQSGPGLWASKELLFPQNLDAVLRWRIFQELAPVPPVESPHETPMTPTQQPLSILSGDLDPTACNRWVDNFFAFVHVKNPILDEWSTQRLVRQICLEGPGWNAPSCLALLVCANGALARHLRDVRLLMDEPDAQVALALFDAAQKRLGPSLVSGGLVSAQCAFLSGVMLMSLLRPLDAWRMFVHGLAICQGFKSSRRHASGHELETGDFTVAEQSITWSCWKSEQEVRSELDMPNVHAFMESSPQMLPEPPQGCNGQLERAWYFYLSEISLWRLEMEDRQQMERLVGEDYKGVLLTLSELGQRTLDQLDAWCNSLPPLVTITNYVRTSLQHGHCNDGERVEDEEDDVIRFVLRGRVTYVRELTSWPFLAEVMNGRADWTPETKKWSAKALESHLERLIVNRPGFYHRHHGTWLMLRTSARSAILLLAFSRLFPDSDLMPEKWRGLVSETISMLDHWSTEVFEMKRVVDIAQQLSSAL